MTIAFDSDPEEARRTRASLLDRVAADKISVSGMHFNLPTTATVQREGSGFSLAYDYWSPAM